MGSRVQVARGLTLLLVSGVMLAGAARASGEDGRVAWSGESWVTSVSLPITDVSDVATDPSSGAVYVTGTEAQVQSDPGSPVIAATHADGGPVTSIPVAGASNLALSDNGAYLWASIPAKSEIDRIDTTTYAVTTFSTADATCPVGLAVVGGKVFFLDAGATCYGDATLHELDPATGDVGPALADGQSLAAYQGSTLAPIPGTTDLLVGSGTTSVVDTQTGMVQATELPLNPSLPLWIAPDGSSVVLETGQELSLPDLTPTGAVVPLGTNLLAMGPDYLVTGFEVSAVMDRSGGAQLNQLQISSDYRLEPVKEFFVGGTLDGLFTDESGGPILMYFDSTPGTPAPDLAVGSLDATVTHPTTISGTLTHDGSPVADVEVTVTDEDYRNTIGVMGTATTDDQGNWSLPFTWPVYGDHYVQVTSAPSGSLKAAITTAWASVSPVSETFTADVPSSTPIGSVVTIPGSLTEDGSPAPGRTVAWSADCRRGSIPDESGTTTTADDGTFSVDLDTGQCAFIQVQFSFAGDNEAPAVKTQVQSISIPWHLQTVWVTTSGTTYVLDDAVDVVHVDTDNAPAANVPVDVHISGPGTSTDEQLTTGSDGTVDVTVHGAQLGQYQVTASTQDTSDTLGNGSGSPTVTTFVKVPSTISIDSVTPTQVDVGDPVTVTGTLDRADGHNAGVQVQVIANDYDANAGTFLRHVVHTVTTDADGHFSATDVPQNAVTTDYTAAYAGDGLRYAAALDAYASVNVGAADRTVTITSDRPSYVAGDRATVTIGLTDPQRATLDVASTNAGGGAPTTLFSGPPGSDQVVVMQVLEHTTTFSASTPADATHRPGSASVTVPVQARLSVRTGLPRRSAATVYQPRIHPAFLGLLEPRRQGACEEFQVEVRRASGWATLVTTGCHATDAAGRASWTWRGAHHAGTRYRVRVIHPTDDLNARSVSPWQNFTFRARQAHG